MLKELFEKVRVEGKIDLVDKLSMRDVLPFVYPGESNSDAATTYYNSGGRSLLFQKGERVYRIKGVDPFGYLTERVARSPKNRIKNVSDAKELLEHQLSHSVERKDLEFTDKKPFGVFYFDQAECEINASRRLGEVYEVLRIEDPCAPLFYKNTGVEKQDDKTYQTVFELPSLEVDIRVHEYMSLLTEKLDQCSTSEIARKSKNMKRLFGRFIYWAGVNTSIFAASGVLPIDSSFHPQNWVISRYQNGYGIFRVDHTSTKLTDQEYTLKALTRKEHGLPPILNEFSVYGSRIDMASNPRQFLKSDKTNLKFSKILLLDPEDLKKNTGIDESGIIGAHNTVFEMGLASVFQKQPLAPIPEEMFLEALA